MLGVLRSGVNRFRWILEKLLWGSGISTGNHLFFFYESSEKLPLLGEASLIPKANGCTFCSISVLSYPSLIEQLLWARQALA